MSTETRSGPADLRAYAEMLRRDAMVPEGMAPSSVAPGGPVWKRWLAATRRRVPDSSVLLATRLLASAAVPLGRRKAARAALGSDVRLHLGCGQHRLEGWVNVDLSLLHADLLWDLRRPLPFADGTVATVFAEHVLEHLPLWHGLDLLDQIHRLLKPGGIVRLGVPDFGRYARGYAGDGDFLDANRPGRPTRLLALAEVAYCYGHLSMWDGATLQAVLESVGFVDIRESAFGESALSPAPDQERHRPETIYVEAARSSDEARSTRTAAP